MGISATSTLIAIAYKTGYSDSAVASGVYTIQCAAPSFSPAAGSYTSATVTITTDHQWREHPLYHQWHYTELDGGHRL